MSENNSGSGDSSSSDTSSAPVEGTAEALTEGAEGKPTPQQVQSQKRKFQYKVDGEDIEEEIDFSNEEDLKKRFQLGHAAKKRMAEAVTEKQKALRITKAFENDDQFLDIISRHPKGREIAEKFLLSKLQDEMMSPEEKEQRSTKNELEQLRKEKADRLESEKQTQAQKLEAQYADSYQKTIIDALNKTSLPKTAGTIKRMASIMKKNLDLGLELTADDLALEVRGELSTDLRSIIGDATGEELIAMFGEDTAKKIRMSDIKKLQEKQSQVYQGGAKPKAQDNVSNRDSSRTMSMEEWKADVERRVKSK